MSTESAAQPTNKAILHLTLKRQWEEALRSGQHRLSTRTSTLDEVGFIHCSFPDQIERTANLHYGDVDEVLVLHIAVERCPDAELRVEEATGEVAGRFPHLYGPIPVEAVITTWRWQRNNGRYVVSDLWP